MAVILHHGRDTIIEADTADHQAEHCCYNEQVDFLGATDNVFFIWKKNAIDKVDAENNELVIAEIKVRKERDGYGDDE
ncbi:hypothetical protein SPI02_21350 [Staphylococcus piscifermentans]|uniref:Uncharacterized protein n=1 Tax=Staphylococcus piscifermentans TaxID=70258 RepID=A0A512QQ37_9STAP|nr:hypothetical protein SPI02_21350 [Staphylococcus piscifermentans]